MPVLRQTKRGARMSARIFLRALAAPACLLVPHPSIAQEAGLRGEISEAATRGQLLEQNPLALLTPLTVDLPPARSAVSDVPDETQPWLSSGAPASGPVREIRQAAAGLPQESDRPKARPQPRIDETTTAAAPYAAAGYADEGANQRTGRENIREGPIENRPGKPQDNPFAPVGIRAGSFDLTLRLDQGLTATSNVDSSPNGSASVLSESALRLHAVSDWSRHAAAFSAYGILRKSVSGASLSEGEGGAAALLNLDLGAADAARAAVEYAVRPEPATSPVTTPGAEPLQHSLLGSLAWERNAGKLRLGIGGSANREAYSNVELSGGGVQSQRDRNWTLALLSIRTGYEVSPAITPFLQAEAGRRFYDLGVDSNGYERSGNRYGLRAGIELDLGEKLSGEFSAGWLEQRFDDARLATIDALDVNASLIWSPIRGAAVALSGYTAVEGATAPGESGSVLYSGLLSMTRQMRADLTASMAFGVEWRDYAASSDREYEVSAEAAATWWLSRYVGLSGRLRHESFRSSLPERDSQTTSAYLGVTVQR
jgi:hypothetical protein